MTKKPVISADHRLDDLTGIGKAIRPLANQLLGKNGVMQIELAANWEEIVGSDLAKYVLVQKISFEKDERTNGTLVLLVLGGAFALEVENKKAAILQKINTFFGYEALNKIKIKQTADSGNFLLDKNVYDKPKKNLVSEKQKTYITELTDGINNESLRLKLERIGCEILANKN